jgi:hypothetical protein
MDSNTLGLDANSQIIIQKCFLKDRQNLKFIEKEKEKVLTFCEKLFFFKFYDFMNILTNKKIVENYFEITFCLTKNFFILEKHLLIISMV